MNDQLSAARAVFHFDIDEPSSINELTEALKAIGDEYREVIKKLKIDKKTILESDYELFITSIKSKCIICEFAALIVGIGPQVISIIQHTNTISDCVKNIYSGVKFFRKNKSIKNLSEGPGYSETQRIQAISKLANGYNGKGKLDMKVVEKRPDGSETIFSVNLSNNELNKAKNNSQKRLDNFKERKNNTHKRVQLSIVQCNKRTSNKTNKRTNDRGIIESISKLAVPVYWESELDAKKVKFNNDNPMTTIYFVDVTVVKNKADGTPKAYHVIKLHKILPQEKSIQQNSNGKRIRKVSIINNETPQQNSNRKRIRKVSIINNETPQQNSNRKRIRKVSIVNNETPQQNSNEILKINTTQITDDPTK